MSLKDQTTLRIVLYEGDGAQALGATDRFAALTTLLERGYAITCATGARPVGPEPFDVRPPAVVRPSGR